MLTMFSSDRCSPARSIALEIGGFNAMELPLRLTVARLRRLPDRVVDQRLAQRPDCARHLVAGSNDFVERLCDPGAVFLRDDERRQQLDGMAAVAGDLRQDLVLL